jgi:hypothetical protein
MAQCEVCGNDYDKTLEITRSIYCCAHCAERSGVEGARDRIQA